MTQRLLPLCLILLSAPLFAAPPAAVQRFADGLETLDGRFEQRAFDANGQLREQSEGRVALAAPRQFRWDYEDPYPQTIVADGTRVWVYDPELEQASVRMQAHEEQSSPLAALIDPAELERQFEVTEEGERDGLTWVRLVPRKTEDAQITEARLAFAEGELRAMYLLDSLQQRSELRFSGWKRNTGLDAKLFRFIPPEGVDVVGDPGTDAEVMPLGDPAG
ncbi:outer membrane lipoprotein chaperone LolA [Pseudomarimonas salicorniae]|uniref:Outer-membrane lipoprotein carrier protein n=1 Tax=Pseudomarimonas salicorniae TaxID=2933270 RepID=A0ABT0GEG6_9GAMM|nr:outer membrane lipoprotein chaperone LolA [Lysobacter sp. CAU 1642]MCK7592941.1 outer membrane lipoprotein chaperone LolA [Lysobacter sp. CAU 1642]